MTACVCVRVEGGCFLALHTPRGGGVVEYNGAGNWPGVIVCPGRLGVTGRPLLQGVNYER
jgi:hypothetical protein